MADPITITHLTAGVITGDGVFDKLMASVSSQLQEEYRTGRITGTEYASLYTATLQSSLDRALTFLLERDKNLLEREILEKQRDTLEIGKTTAEHQRDLAAAQILNMQASTAQIQAQTTLVISQELGADADTALTTQRTLNSVIEGEIAELEKVKSVAQTAQLQSQTALITSQKLGTDAEALLTAQKKLNAITEETVLSAQECKLRAEFDVLVKTLDKMSTEILLLNQKKVTETAQTNGAGVTADSVIGKQTLLYGNQAAAFLRDAEQKAAGIMTDVWNVSRTTDEGTPRDTDNKLTDVNIGAVVTKLMDGVGA